MNAIIDPGRRQIQRPGKLGDGQKTGDETGVGLAAFLEDVVPETDGCDGTGKNKVGVHGRTISER